MEGHSFSERVERTLTAWAAQLACMRSEREQESYHASSQRDVGKSALEAADVQAVVYELNRYRHPDEGFGYLDQPDPPDAA